MDWNEQMFQEWCLSLIDRHLPELKESGMAFDHQYYLVVLEQYDVSLVEVNLWRADGSLAEYYFSTNKL